MLGLTTSNEVYEAIKLRTTKDSSASVQYMKDAINSCEQEKTRAHEAKILSEKIDVQLVKSWETSHEILSSLLTYKTELSKAASPKFQYHFLGVTDPTLLILWPVAFFSLSTIIIVSKPKNTKATISQTVGHAIPLALSIYAITHSPTFVRNFVFYSRSRTIYSWVNYDVSKLGFILQEILYFAVSSLIAVIWHQWSTSFAREKEPRIASQPTEADLRNRVFGTNETQKLNSLFVQWQFNSILLAACFLNYTHNCWDAIIAKGDYRYLPQAFIMHALWGVTWLIVSLPLILVWTRWHEAKNRLCCIFALQGSTGISEFEAIGKYLSEVQPLKSWKVVLAVMGAFGSFFFPVLQSLWR